MKSTHIFHFFILILGFAYLSVAKAQNYNNPPEFYKYTVNSAEGFYSVCKKFNVTKEEIIKYNPNAKDGLKSGQELLIPIKGVNFPKTNMGESEFKHTISTGETLYSIARMYNVSPQSIIALNPEAKSGIKAGAVLIIPQNYTYQKAEKISSDDNKYIYHTITAKETLFSLSRRYHTSVESILKDNPGLSPENFTIGKVIRIMPYDGEPEIASHQPQMQYRDYTVKRKETLYSIAQKFDIKVSDIVKANPEISKLEQGDKLKIPVFTNVPTKEESAIAETTTLNQIYSKLNPITQTGQINVAIMLPFMLDHPEDVKNSLYTEYYQGFLLAVDSMRKQGANINIYAYDTNNSKNRVNQIINSPEFKNMDLIIGPVNDSYLSTVADFAEKNDINIVNAFSLKNEDVNQNSKIFQTNIPHSYLYAETIAEFIKRFKHKKIVFVNSTPDNDDKKDFTTELKKELVHQNIAYSEIDISNTMDVTIGNLFPTTTATDIVIVPSSGNRSIVGRTVAPLSKLADSRPDMSITLFGYPEWQTYTKDYLDSYYKLNTYIFTRFYAVPTDTDMKNFDRNFHYWYNKDMINANPKYGLLGFDTGIYFLTALHRYGKNIGREIENMTSNSLQTDFKFRRINNWSGFINKSLYFVHFTPYYTIERIAIK